MESIVTKYKEICFFCSRQSEGEHHLLFGIACREKCDEDGLKVPICNNCHNMGDVKRRIHDNPMAEKLSKMLGQALWEKEWILKDAIHDKDDEKEAQRIEQQVARKEFQKRYGKSYL